MKTQIKLILNFFTLLCLLISCDDKNVVNSKITEDFKFEIDSAIINIQGISAIFDVKSSYGSQGHSETDNYIDTNFYILNITTKNLFSENSNNPYCKISNKDTITLCSSQKINLSNQDMQGSEKKLTVVYLIIDTKRKMFKKIIIISDSDKETSATNSSSNGTSQSKNFIRLHDISYTFDSMKDEIIVDIDKFTFLSNLDELIYESSGSGQALNTYSNGSTKLLSINNLSENFICKITLKKLK